MEKGIKNNQEHRNHHIGMDKQSRVIISLRFFKIWPAWLLIMTLILFRSMAWSHPADQYFQAHHINISYEQIELKWSISPGPLMVPWVWQSIDLDGNRQVSEKEVKEWWKVNMSALKAALNEQPFEWTLKQVQWPDSMMELQTGEIPITALLTSRFQNPPTFPQKLELTNRLFEKTSVCWFSIQTENGILIKRPQQRNSRLRIELIKHPLTGSDDVSETLQNEGLKDWDSGTPSLRWTSRKFEESAIERNVSKSFSMGTKTYGFLKDLLHQKNLSAVFIFLAFIISVILGALHAVTPGHGKTIVAAYLVGSRGTVGHAVMLGAIVTATHTGSVFLLGLLVLTVSDYFLPTQIFPVLEISSGLLIVGLGVYLLGKRWRHFSLDLKHAHHHHSHHHHLHHHHHPNQKNSSEVSWRSLTTLGISGGLVPCPDAIAILLLAVAIKRIVLGLILIVGFSLGLAVVLTVIGIAMVHSGRLLKKNDRMGALIPIMPVVSAVIVLVLGVCLTWNAGQNIRSQMPSTSRTAAFHNALFQSGKYSKKPDDPIFDLKSASIVYLDRDNQNNLQLFATPVNSSATQPLSQSPYGVTDYAVGPDGLKIVYATRNETGNCEFWMLDMAGKDRRLLFECPGKTCSRPVWSPDGISITYECTSLPSKQMPMGVTSIRSYHVALEADSPVLNDQSIPCFNASWSQDGRWFGYATHSDQQMRLCDLIDGSHHMIPNSMGTPVFWRPGGQKLLFIEPATDTERFQTHLFLFDLIHNTSTDLSTGFDGEDSFASWSPDGRWIAVLRRNINESETATGNEIYLIGEDGKAVRQLTNDPEVIHGAPVWSSDGAFILFHRLDLQSSTKPSICLLEVQTSKFNTIVSSGSQPNWIRKIKDT